MARLPSYGTAAVAANTTAVTWTGDPLTPILCDEGFEVVIEGRTNFVSSLTDTTHFVLAMPHSGGGGSGLPAAINPITDVEKSTAELNARVARLLSNLDLTDANGRGMYLSYVANSDGDPGVGNASFNNSDPGSSTHMYLSATDENNQDISDILALIQSGTVLVARSLDTQNFVRVLVQAKVTNPTYVDFVITPMSASGALAEDEALAVEWNRQESGGNGLQFDERVSNLAARATYDLETTGFAVLVEDTGEALPRSAIYFKNSPTSGDWSGALYITGPTGPGGNHVALSDEVTIITVGPNKMRWRSVGALLVTGVRASLNEASTSGLVTIDVKLEGISILSTLLTIDANEKTSVTASTPVVISNPNIPDDAEISVDIVNAGTNAIGLKVALLAKTV